METVFVPSVWSIINQTVSGNVAERTGAVQAWLCANAIQKTTEAVADRLKIDSAISACDATSPFRAKEQAKLNREAADLIFDLAILIAVCSGVIHEHVERLFDDLRRVASVRVSRDCVLTLCNALHLQLAQAHSLANRLQVIEPHRQTTNS